jgi:DNA-binding HxlR family transcriptional regulator
LLVIRELLAGSTHFNDIRRGVPRISATLLKERLETLEHAEVIERKKSTEGGGYEYVLTKAGQELRAVLTGIGEWGQRWARDIRPEDLDPGWLVWNVHRRLNTAELPAGKTVIQIEFTDRSKDGRYFWLVCNRGNVEVCLKHPGYSIDLHVRTTVRVFAESWRGIRSVREEISAGSIGLDGKASLRRAFPKWLLLSAYASIPRMR